MPRTTHTYALFEVSRATFDEIAAKLREADYDHAFDADGTTIDMHGIGLRAEPAKPPATHGEQLSVHRAMEAKCRELEALLGLLLHAGD